jgi:hypothetical protein
VAVLTVVAEAPDHVLYGDLIDAETSDQTKFVGAAGVADAVRSWVREALPRRGAVAREGELDAGAAHDSELRGGPERC